MQSFNKILVGISILFCFCFSGLQGQAILGQGAGISAPASDLSQPLDFHSGTSDLSQPLDFHSGTGDLAMFRIAGHDDLENNESFVPMPTVTDTIPPTAVCQDITVYVDGAGTVSIVPADVDGGSTDNTGITTSSLSQSSFTCANLGSQFITLTVGDSCGLTDACNAGITISDTTSPVAVCTNITVVLDGSGAATITGADIDGGSTDNCSVSSATASTTSFACGDTGSNSVTLTATDGSANTGTCTATVTVEDTTSPTATCQDITLYLNGSGNATLAAADIDNGSSDNCGSPTLSASLTSFTCADTGTSSVTLTATDASANSATCTADVVVEDTTSPAMVCQNLTVELDGSGNASITTGDVNNGSSDNCGINTLAIDVSAFTCADAGSNTVTLTGVDVSSNSGTCTSTVTVQDTASPTAICQDITVYVNGSGNATVTATDVDNGSSDNCSITSRSLTTTAFTCSDLGTNSETLTVTDVSANTATCSTTITVLDTTSPTAVCNAYTAYLDGSGNATVTVGDVGGGASSDNCAGGSAVLSQTAFTCADTGTISYTLTITDGSSNTDVCTDQITVEDTTSPAMVCQDVTIYLDGAGSASITTGDIDNSSSDNCGLTGLVASQTSFSCADVGNNTVTLTGTDVSSNSGNCTSSVTVLDTITPTVTCQNLTLFLDVNGNASITTGDVDAGSGDNCSGSSLALSQSAFTCADVGANTITLTITDQSSNTRSCNSSVTVQDTTSPAAVCSNVTLSLNGGGNATLTTGAVDNGSSDACTITSTVLSTTSFSCVDTGTTVVTMTLTDANGNTNTCNSNVTILDDTPPSMVCQNITVQLNGSGNASIVTADIDGGTSDNCGLSSINAGTLAFTCADVGSNTVSLTAVDVSSNTANCNAIVTVEDNIAPNAVCTNLTIFLDVSGNASITTSDVDNGSTDNCSINNYALNTSSFTCSDVGANPVTLTVTDVNTNASTCSATIMVMDTTSPAAVCQNVTLNLNGSGNATLTSSALDNGSSDACTIVSSVVSTSSFSCVDTGTTTITLNLTDANGNTNSCTGNVTIQDVTPPSMVCSNLTVQLDAAGNGSITVADVNNGTSDNCGVNNLSISKSAFLCSDVGSNTVILTGTDVSSNTATCSSNVTVEDNVNPIAVCQNLTIQLDGSGNASITSANIDNGSSDACGINTRVLNKSNFTCSDLGGNTVNMTVTDVNGNQSSCSAIVQVRDTISPNAVCQNITAYLNGSGVATASAAAVGSASTDNCTITSNSLSTSSFLCFDIGPNNVTYSVSDQSSNSSSCAAVVTVADTTSPAISCQNITLQLNSSGTATITPASVDGGTTDNCGILSSLVSTSSFTCADVGANVVTLTVDDINGNTSNCNATVTVQDNVDPTAVCQSLTVYLDGSGTASITTGDVDTGTSDACGIASLTLNTTSFNCSTLGVNPVVMTAVDANGNTSVCNLAVLVIDSTPPAAVCQNLTLYLNGSGNASTNAATVGGASSDNCSIASNVLSNGTFTCADVGANLETITVEDPSGNVSVCNATITVEDTTSPIMLCNNLTVQLNASGTALLTTAALDGGSTDNCSIGSLQLSQTNISCADRGVNAISLLGIDVNGNSNNCVSTVTVVDQLPPTAVCQNLTVYLNGSGAASITPVNTDAGSSDNCSINNYVLSTSNFNCSNIGANTVGMTVSDASFNSNTCVSVVTVIDSTPPAAICRNITATLGPSGSITINNSDIDNNSSDNCTISSLVLTQSTFTCSDIGSNAITLTATDQSNNIGTCSANVFVRDTAPPTVVCLPLTIALDGNGADTITTADLDGGSTDNCSISSLTLNTSIFGCSDVGTVPVTMTAIDPFGNTTSCTSNVVVQDTVPPNAQCVSNFTVNLNSFGTGSLSLTDINNGSGDNCTIQTAFVSQSTFTCSEVGNQVVTLFITDANGNADSCSTSVSVEDNLPPNAVCQNIATSIDTSGFVLLTSTLLNNGSSDNCGIANFDINIDTLDCSNIGVTQVQMIVTDPSGNADTCTSNVSLQDNTPPTAACTDITAYLDNTGNLTVTGNDVAPNSFDNCGITYFLIGNTFDCNDLGNNQVFVTVTDPNNLSNSCASIVTVADSTPPTVNCQNITVTLPANNTVSIAIGDVTSSAPSDNCGVQTSTLDVTTFTCVNAGVNTVTVTSTDVNSNSSSCTSEVTVVDALEPDAVCQSLTVALDGQGNATVTPTDADGGSTDNCGVDSLAISEGSFTCSDTGITTQTLYVYDLFGNVDSCDLEITIVDNTPPIAVCTSDTIGVDTGQVVFINPSILDGGSSDNCGIASLTTDPDSITIADLGFNSIVLTVTDVSGNTSSCNTTIFVEQMVGIQNAVTLDASVQFDAYPNPTQAMLTIDVNCIDCIFREDAQVTLLDMRGKMLDTYQLSRNRRSHTLQIDLSNYALGKYLIRLETERGKAVHQVVKY